jgi:hypothetical protein
VVPLVVSEPTLGVDQVTAVFEELVTVAVSDEVDVGQFVSLGQILVGLALTVTLTGVLLLPPQAIMKPTSASEKHRRPMAEPFVTFPLTFPRIRPSITTPAMGSVSGSHGERLGERLADRWRSSVGIPEFGPVVFMVIVTVDADDPAGMVADEDEVPPFTL